jgi:hypothetical protein
MLNTGDFSLREIRVLALAGLLPEAPLRLMKKNRHPWGMNIRNNHHHPFAQQLCEDDELLF